MSVLDKMFDISSVLDEMFDVSSDTAEIHKFFDFAWKVHEATECIKSECDIACFIIQLKEAFLIRTRQSIPKNNELQILEVWLRENNKSTASVVRALQAIGEDKGEKLNIC